RASEGAAHAVSRFDLTLFMRDKGKGIAGVLEYATSLFDEATVLRIGGYLRTMLAGMVEDEGREIGTIELQSPEERGQLLGQMPLTANGKVDRRALPKPEDKGKEWRGARTPQGGVGCGVGGEGVGVGEGVGEGDLVE